MKKNNHNSEFRTTSIKVATDWNSAVEVAEQHIDVRGCTFSKACKSYIMDDGDNRVSLSTRDLKATVIG